LFVHSVEVAKLSSDRSRPKWFTIHSLFSKQK
jgi:hypothetical protein